MGSRTYLNFDLLLEKTPTGFNARVLNSPVGQASYPFVLPFSSSTPPRPRDLSTAAVFGKQLFDAVFADKILVAFRSSATLAMSQNQGLRINLRLNDVPELAALPWELLHDGQDFLLLSTHYSVVRYLELERPVETLFAKLPLQALVMLASPKDYPPLDMDGEWERLQRALADSHNPGVYSFERLARASIAELQKALWQKEYPILHIGGHGEFRKNAEPGNSGGALVLEAEDGSGEPKNAIELARVLRDYKPLRLVVLNTCQGAQADTMDVFSGLAQSLVQQGVPAVVAMQFPVTDTAAQILSRTCYGALAEGLSLDEALGETRKAIAAELSSLEWATPVLFTRAEAGNILDSNSIDAGQRNKLNLGRLAVLARDALAQEDFARADDCISRLLAIEPTNDIGHALEQRAQRGKELQRLYVNAKTLYDQARFDEALPLLKQVFSLQMNYRDTVSLIAGATERQNLVAGAPLTKINSIAKPDKYDSQYKDMSKWLLKGRIVPFLGLGVNLYGRTLNSWQSAGSPPTAEELAAYLAANFEYDGPDTSDLIRVSQYVAFTKSPSALYEEIRNLFAAPHTPTPLHRFWAGLPARLRAAGVLPERDEPIKSGETMTYPIIFTANYDDLLEQAFRDAEEPYDLLIYLAVDDKDDAPTRVYESGKYLHRTWEGAEIALDKANEYGNLNLRRRTTIVKLHGSLNREDADRDSYVITEDHYLAYLQSDTSSLLPSTLTARVKDLYPLFMGCNLRNWNLRALLYRLGRTNNRPWMIQPEARSTDIDYWHAFNVQVLDTPFDEFLLNLSARISEPAGGKP